MTTRPSLSLSRNPSSSRSFRSRRSSTGSNDNIFGDDFALDSPVTIDDEPLGNVPPPRQQYFDNPFNDTHASQFSPYPETRPTHLDPQPDRGSIAKRRLMIDDVPSTSERGLGRSISTSSRITIPRSQSPYNGPTAPSHPYAMYSQMTRSSSVASGSNLMPGSETPFIPRGGPQHPYHMYPQNTVPEEGEDITTNGIPLGFPRTNFQPSSGGSSSDVGDIIGSDGHIEHLPPYTRYADNTVAKGNMDNVSVRRQSRAPTVQSLEATTHPTPPSVAASSSLLQPREQFEEETEAQRARKEGWRDSWRDRAMRPTPVGMPVWGLIVLVLIIIFAATIGGVVGGIIGNKQGAQRAYANGAVVTTWLDAIPTQTGPDSSPLPTGHYQIPFNQSQEVNQCITNPDQMGSAWGCMDIAYIGVNVFKDQESGAMHAQFEDFSVNTMDFRYGPQPPDFNGTAFKLAPMLDTDASDLGAAMFFSVLFDKLTIVPEHVLENMPEKRAIDGRQFQRRGPASYDGTPLVPEQRPWFCFWNSTINEFFIYLNEDAPAEPSTTYKRMSVSTTTQSTPATTSYVFDGTTSGVLLQEMTMTTAPTQAATTFQAYNPTFSARASPTWSWQKRSYETSASDIVNYPKLVKMVEKRKPADDKEIHVQPYCQQMQVLDNMEIVPLASVEPICIEEVQYTMAASTSSQHDLGRRALKVRGVDRDVVGDLESYCICEWTSQ